MTTPNTTPIRKLIDVAAICAVLDAEKHLVHGSLVTSILDGNGEPLNRTILSSEDLPEPGPLAVANCEHVGRCAMGSLLYASGKISYYELTGMGGDAREWPLRPVKVLYDAYGLQRHHAQEIIDANDLQDGEDEPSIAKRRTRVKERVRQLAERQVSQPANDFEDCAKTERQAANWEADAVSDHDERLAQLGLLSALELDD